jgi:hypothetical protein
LLLSFHTPPIVVVDKKSIKDCNYVDCSLVSMQSK